jgi:CheY-like chemotaxis protein/anti-sigma regulatory factor (Ser/Thr protein kinase)
MLSDGVRLKQIVTNLLSNALKFTSHGSITLEVRIVEGSGRSMLAIADSDTGAGIEPEAMSRLFQAYEQAQSTSDQRHSGTGLGLFISRKLARLMGGELTCDSELGRGSGFELTLPIIVAAETPEVKKEHALDGPIRALIVDDHGVNQQAFSLILKAVGAEVTLADDGLAAVEAAQRVAFDVILMDVNMPRMSGVEATRVIRTRAGPNRATPIIALTGEVSDEVIGTCSAAGMNAFARKPVEPTELLQAITDVLSNVGKVETLETSAA